MAEEEMKKDKQWKNRSYGGGGSGAIYGIGLLGAAFYYLQHAATLEAWIIGIVKAILWPGVIVFKVFELLKL